MEFAPSASPPPPRAARIWAPAPPHPAGGFGSRVAQGDGSRQVDAHCPARSSPFPPSCFCSSIGARVIVLSPLQRDCGPMAGGLRGRGCGVFRGEAHGRLFCSGTACSANAYGGAGMLHASRIACFCHWRGWGRDADMRGWGECDRPLVFPANPRADPRGAFLCTASLVLAYDATLSANSSDLSHTRPEATIGARPVPTGTRFSEPGIGWNSRTSGLLGWFGTCSCVRVVLSVSDQSYFGVRMIPEEINVPR
jgi:hypothetical protein